MKEVFDAYLQDVKYKDWSITVQMDGERPYLQVVFLDHDSRSPHGGKMAQKGRKWMLSPYMTKSEVVQTAFKAVLTAEEHECRERFTYRGKTIFGPHFSVDRLAAICGGDSLDIRPDIHVEAKERA